MYTTKLNKTTKKAEWWIKQYFMSSCFSVRNYYKNCSKAKISIEQRIHDRMIKNDLLDYRVLSGNSFYFTVGYMDKSENTLYVETISNIYEIDLRD